MEKKYIAVFDSGIGGLNMLNMLLKEFPNESYIYLGDNFNAPYGEKSKRKLEEYAIKSLIQILKYDVKLIAVACNTLSINVLEKIKTFSPVPVVAVFPPVERSLLYYNNVLLLSTRNTAEKYKNIKGLTAFHPDNLVKDIENNILDISKIDLCKHFYPVKGHFDSIILGCTHYNFVKIGIINHFQPKNICFGETDTINQIKRLNLIKNVEKIKQNEVLFIGEARKNNQIIWNKIKNFLNFSNFF